MMEWKNAYDRRDWIAVDNWWRRSEDKEARQALFDQLQRDRPRRQLLNGTDKEEVPVPAKDVPPEWAEAVEILELGELEASIECDPPSSAEIWADQFRALSEELRALAASPEVTKGDDELSRASHAGRALEALDQIEQKIPFYLDLFEPAERGVLEEFAAILAINALRAGHFANAAGSKVPQSHAIRGQKILYGAKAGGTIRAKEAERKRKEALEEMRRLIERGHTKSQAARIAVHNGFGSSPEANRQLLKRYLIK
ncbi:hypothetical protein MASR1M32_21710 [Rhodobacter sp.]